MIFLEQLSEFTIFSRYENEDCETFEPNCEKYDLVDFWQRILARVTNNFRYANQRDKRRITTL